MINTTGVWVGALRARDSDALGRTIEPMVAPSQGVRLEADRSLLPRDRALRMPSTANGRGLFGNAEGNTKRLSREHTIAVSASGLVTITGGKWSSYRAMVGDVLARPFRLLFLHARAARAGALAAAAVLQAETGVDPRLGARYVSLPA